MVKNGKKPKNKGGRPTKYDQNIAKEICQTISKTNKSLFSLCETNDHWPCMDTVYEWRLVHKEFSEMYARAKIIQADFLAEETLEIADDSSKDTIIVTDDNGREKEVADHEWINRSRLRVDTRKWITAKLVPRVYADKIYKADDEEKKTINNIDLENITPDEAYVLMQKLLAKCNGSGK